MAKADYVITMYYSTGGTKWFLTRLRQFDAKSELGVGFMALSPAGTSCEVSFTNMNYEKRKIKDPRTGE